ncbi:expressed unknown protein [Seminavis robusta]|uniref:Uncharacterized protein n=1 Tax=Seminavis robusta TaxID=568900 RepID=A0A9N8D467_9STRA|nr:expressed unknown protein [Seminavis robusta]|eukprot:Sro1_g000060.1 n/a (88) ;mRNA; r:19457-19720
MSNQEDNVISLTEEEFSAELDAIATQAFAKVSQQPRFSGLPQAEKDRIMETFFTQKEAAVEYLGRLAEFGEIRPEDIQRMFRGLGNN